MAATVSDICTLYREAPILVAQGERIVSADALTNVQALERQHVGLALVPGQVERRAFESIRHGTGSFILNRDVDTGQIMMPSFEPTRTDADFLVRLQHTVASAPAATRWHFVVDTRTTHCSESLVCWVTAESGVEDLVLGETGTRGMVASMSSRAAFVSDPSRTIHSGWVRGSGPGGGHRIPSPCP